MVSYKRLLLGILLMMAILSGCNRHTCPTYLSTYQYNANAKPQQFFAYFDGAEEDQGSSNSGAIAPSFTDIVDDTAALVAAANAEDTVQNEHGLLIFTEGEEPSDFAIARTSGRNKNGVMKKNKYIFGIPLIKRKPKRSDKFPRSVNTKNPRPFEVKEEGAEEDSTHSLVQKKEPPKSMDQLYYEVVFGVPGAQDSTAEEGAEENELEEEGEIPADETKKERKKRLKRERKEAKRKKKEEKRMRKNGELPPIEEEDKEEGSTEEDPIGSARPPGKGTETAKADDF